MSAALHSSAPALERWRSLAQSRPAEDPRVQAARGVALEKFLAQGFPTQRDEDWKYTNLRRLESRSFVVPEAAPFDTAAVERYVRSTSGCCALMFVNGRPAPALSSPPAGALQVRTLGELLQNSPADAAQLLQCSNASSFDALNAALAFDGAVIDVPADARVETPVYVLHYTTSSPASMTTQPRTVIRAGRNSRVQVVEHYVGDEGSEYFTNAASRIELAEGAVVEHYRLQEEGSRSFHIGATQAVLRRDAQLVSYNFAIGASLSQVALDITLAEPGARADLHGLFLVDGNRHLDMRTFVDHAAPRTVSTEDYRGIAADRGRGIFNGKVYVAKDAQKISAQQSTRNLLLNAGCEIDAKPALEIYADDVKCSHGATVGQLDASALFYLRSRGISEEEARSILTIAFAESLLERIPLKGLQEHLDARLREALKSHGRAAP